MNSVYREVVHFSECPLSEVPLHYSRTSDKGPSEIGTTSLQRPLVAHHASVLFYLRDRDNLSTRDKTISPKVSLVWMCEDKVPQISCSSVRSMKLTPLRLERAPHVPSSAPVVNCEEFRKRGSHRRAQSQLTGLSLKSL